MKHRLTQKMVRDAVPGKIADGDGLWLWTKESGAQSWFLRINEDGKRKEIGLGGTKDVTLQEARAKAEAYRAAPSVPELKSAPTFAEVQVAFLHLQAPKWRNPKSRAQWDSSLKAYARPLQRMRVTDIATADVVKCLTPIWHAKPETARRVAGRVRQILSYCIAMGYRPAPNPAAWESNLEHILPRQNRNKGHHAAVPVEDAEVVFHQLWQRRGKGTGYAALCFTILGAFRSGEVRHLTWDEVQDDRIVIPAAKMKAGRDHRVPLTPVMRELLPPRGTGLVFPGTKGAPLSDMTLAACHKRLGIDATVHGWRSTFADWAVVSGKDHRLVEDALAHQLGSEVERAYRRTDYYDRRVDLMRQWEFFLFGAV